MQNSPSSFRRHSTQAKISAVWLVLRLKLLHLRAWLTGREVVVVSLLEHFGDIVACEPVLPYLRQTHPKALLVWITRPLFKSLLAAHPEVHRCFTIPCLTSWVIARRYLKGTIVDLHLAGRECSTCRRELEKIQGRNDITLRNYYNFGPLLTAFSLAAGLPPLDAGPRIWLAPESVRTAGRFRPAGKYVVVHCKSNESERDWTAAKWGELGRAITGLSGYTVVEIGLQSVLAGQSCVFTNLCGQLDLAETAAIIKEATLFVGIDSGPAHFANANEISSVILLGKYRNFARYMPYTGFFANGGATILRASGPAAELTLEEVVPAVESRLGGPATPAADILPVAPAPARSA